jgi:hypothetical protein
MDIRKKTCLIIRKGNEYLVGTICFSTDLRWSIYASDAWRTRDREAAEMVAQKVGGVLVLYNPVINEAKLL